MAIEEVMSEEDFLKLSLVEQFKILEYHSDRALAFAGARRRQLQEETDELDLMLKELTTSRDETTERKGKIVEMFGSLEAADAEAPALSAADVVKRAIMKAVASGDAVIENGDHSLLSPEERKRKDDAMVRRVRLNDMRQAARNVPGV